MQEKLFYFIERYINIRSVVFIHVIYWVALRQKFWFVLFISSNNKLENESQRVTSFDNLFLINNIFLPNQEKFFFIYNMLMTVCCKTKKQKKLPKIFILCQKFLPMNMHQNAKIRRRFEKKISKCNIRLKCWMQLLLLKCSFYAKFRVKILEENLKKINT